MLALRCADVIGRTLGYWRLLAMYAGSLTNWRISWERQLPYIDSKKHYIVNRCYPTRSNTASNASIHCVFFQICIFFCMPILGPCSDMSGLIGAMLSRFRLRRAYVVPFLAMETYVGPMPGKWGPCWAMLSHVEPCWAYLVCLGTCWAKFDNLADFKAFKSTLKTEYLGRKRPPS